MVNHCMLNLRSVEGVLNSVHDSDPEMHPSHSVSPVFARPNISLGDTGQSLDHSNAEASTNDSYGDGVDELP